ncbi:MAG: hypothetical protein AB7O96_06930, partial [Pseudobdellovibrionaceae bacterium]
GISSPAVTSPINYSRGFTHENAAIAASLSGAQLSLEYDTGEDDNNTNKGYGAEIGYGNGNVGAMAGYYKRDCDNCEGRAGGLVGVGGSSFTFGIGYREENHYSIGLLMGQSGSNRIGIIGEFVDSEDDTQDMTSAGIGWSYNAKSWVFALDASKQTVENGQNNDVVLVTPGLRVGADFLSISISYDMYTNDKNEVYDDHTWFGIGFKGNSGQLAIYHDYVNDWSLVGSFWF